VPRIFTGDSRIGTADGGYLIEKYVPDLNMFNKDCGDDLRVAKHMHAALLAIVEPAMVVRQQAWEQAEREKEEEEAAMELAACEALVASGEAADVEGGRTLLWTRRMEQAQAMMDAAAAFFEKAKAQLEVARRESLEARAAQAAEGPSMAARVFGAVKNLDHAEKVAEQAMQDVGQKAGLVRYANDKLGIAMAPMAMGEEDAEAKRKSNLLEQQTRDAEEEARLTKVEWVRQAGK
jgi:hypothetical protein